MFSHSTRNLAPSRITGAAPCIAAALVLLLLAACASTPAPRTLLAPAAQQALLYGLEGFSLNGRVLIRAGERGDTASLVWQQRGEQATVRLSGPFGAGSLTVSWQPGVLRLTGGRGEEFVDAEAEQVLVEQLGFVPPFEALRYWVLGLAAPGEAPAQRTLAQSGRIGELVQQQWHIRYEQWMSVAAGADGVELPRLLTATRDELRLRVVVDNWNL